MKQTDLSGFCTKFALTEGIQRVRVRPEGRFLIWTRPADGADIKLSRGVNFFGTLEAASVAALRMARKRIRSFERQIARLRPLASRPKLARGLSSTEE